MRGIEGVLARYDEVVRMPWDRTVAGPQKVWFAVYDPAQERRLRLRVGEFAIATQRAGYGWSLIDLTTAFARWMAGHRYREAYFEDPADMQLALETFAHDLAAEVGARLSAPDADEETVVAVMGLASLFGLARASALIEAVAPAIRGRLLVFFPGQYENAAYRLLGARDGWNYLAIPITAADDE